MAYEVRLKGGTSWAKVRSPGWSVAFTVLTLGIYGAYWWYQVNRELRDLGRVHQRPELGDSPALSVLAVTLGALVLVPPFVSLYRGCQRVEAAQSVAGIEERDRFNGWIALVLVVIGFAFVFVPLVIAYIQSELNKVWRTEALASSPGGPELAPQPAPGPAAAPAAPLPATATAPPAPAVPAQVEAPAPPPSQPAAPAPGATDPQLERLERLAALRDSGGITPEEYETQKAKILDEL